MSFSVKCVRVLDIEEKIFKFLLCWFIDFFASSYTVVPTPTTNLSLH